MSESFRQSRISRPAMPQMYFQCHIRYAVWQFEEALPTASPIGSHLPPRLAIIRIDDIDPDK
jgi:hypothetical protein